MRFIKEVLGRIFACWAFTWFVSGFLLFFIPMLATGILQEPKRTVVFWRLSRGWMRFFFFITGLRLKIRGKENFLPGEKYIVVCNHNTLMDIPVSTPFIPGANKTIAKIEMTRIPLFGLIYKRGAVLVDRKNEESRRASFIEMKNVLASGLHMCIYPEGTRNRTNEPLGYFHDGAFRLSTETGHLIIPALIFYTKKVLPSKSFYFWPHRIEIHFLKAVVPGDSSGTALKERIFLQMKEYYVQHNQ